MDTENTLYDIHKKFAVDCFNKCWDLIDKKERTHYEELNMIYLAHVSRYHWGEIGSVVEFLRGEWQISHVYAVLQNGEMSLFHGLESLNLCLDNSIDGFDLCFAYEAVARGYKLLNNEEKFNQFLSLAKITAESIADVEDRKYFLSQLIF